LYEGSNLFSDTLDEDPSDPADEGAPSDPADEEEELDSEFPEQLSDTCPVALGISGLEL